MNKVASPCIRNCCLNEKDVCLGCFRSIDEILIWGTATEDQKKEVLYLAQKRKGQYEQVSNKYK